MARIPTDPNYSSPTFPRATAGTDLFLKEDVQALAAAVSTHDHSTGKGVALTAGAIPNGTITSAMIADGTIVAGDIADGTITSAKIADGTLVAADHADASLTNAKLASDTARANLLTNGGFEIWQRGNGPVTVHGTYAADRWYVNLDGSDTLSATRDTTTWDIGSASCMVCVYTRASGVNTLMGQKVEDYLGLRGRTVSLSVRVRSSVVGAVRAAIYDSTSGWRYSAANVGTGAYETLTVTAPIGLGATLVQVAVFFAASCTAYLDSAMLVVGSVPADYAPLHPADDLARCLRYYEHFEDNNFIMSGAPGAGATVRALYYYKARKAVTPTVTKTGTWTLSNLTGQPTVAAGGVNFTWLTGTATAAGDAYAWADAAGKDLTIESNP